jgi:hypothetical protein
MKLLSLNRQPRELYSTSGALHNDTTQMTSVVVRGGVPIVVLTAVAVMTVPMTVPMTVTVTVAVVRLASGVSRLQFDDDAGGVVRLAQDPHRLREGQLALPVVPRRQHDRVAALAVPQRQLQTRERIAVTMITRFGSVCRGGRGVSVAVAAPLDGQHPLQQAAVRRALLPAHTGQRRVHPVRVRRQVAQDPDNHRIGSGRVAQLHRRLVPLLVLYDLGAPVAGLARVVVAPKRNLSQHQIPHYELPACYSLTESL